MWLESHETSYMIGHFWEGVSTIFAIVQVYYFFSQLGNIKWHNAKALYFFEFFWTSYARFKMRSKGRAWTFLARGWILQNYLWIYDKTSTCEPKNDFLKKLWENYDTVVVQIYLTSYWIGKSLSFLWKVNAKLHTHKKGDIYVNVSYYCWKLGWYNFVMYFQ
jgi:hypothetical protein